MTLTKFRNWLKTNEDWIRSLSHLSTFVIACLTVFIVLFSLGQLKEARTERVRAEVAATRAEMAQNDVQYLKSELRTIALDQTRIILT